MAIRDNIRRALRRSDLSDSSQSEATSPVNSTSPSSKTSVSSKDSGSSSRLARTRTWTWGGNKKIIDSGKENAAPKYKSKRRVVHPSERPLTEQNLRHQEMLAQFTWTFGASCPDQVEEDGFVGVSPCCTRAPSLADYDPNADSDRSSTSLDV